MNDIIMVLQCSLVENIGEGQYITDRFQYFYNHNWIERGLKLESVMIICSLITPPSNKNCKRPHILLNFI